MLGYKLGFSHQKANVWMTRVHQMSQYWCYSSLSCECKFDAYLWQRLLSCLVYGKIRCQEWPDLRFEDSNSTTFGPLTWFQLVDSDVDLFWHFYCQFYDLHTAAQGSLWALTVPQHSGLFSFLLILVIGPFVTQESMWLSSASTLVFWILDREYAPSSGLETSCACPNLSYETYQRSENLL